MFIELYKVESYLIFKLSPGGRQYHYFHFTDAEKEASRAPRKEIMELAVRL